jgi:hypothetical protein
MFGKKNNPKYEIISEDIKKIFDILKNKSNWCQRSLAFGINNERLFNPYDEAAIRFDILGAAYKINADKETISFLENISIQNGYQGIDRLNDLNNHEDIVNFLLECLDSLGYNTKKLRKDLK